ncbi:MAG: high-affinity nickel-transport family protein [Candidatus Rokubacteria bacterium]|nr:high-affinity nickel-transport family protein [Candidatus Rokubacteria bacterium]
MGEGAQDPHRRGHEKPRHLTDQLVAAVLLGFVLGLQHATDPDHLVAVATIVTRERRFADGALVGALWGLGHTATLVLAGTAIVAFRLTLGAGLVSGLELAVAAMLVLLGALRLRDAARGAAGVPREHLVAVHDHGHLEAVHSHPHAHGEHVHAHPHVHPSRRLLAALAVRRDRLPLRALLVGAVHGMAGSAAASLLVLAALPTPLGAFVYLAVFGLGSIGGMMALTAVMAYPVALAHRFGAARRALAAGAGLGSIAFGVVYGLRAL